METLVIGLGQIGSALSTVLSDKYLVDGIDINNSTDKKYDFINICFPCSNIDDFVQRVQEYKAKYLGENGLCVIHSTVPVGTTKRCNAIHSPVRGIHPNLVSGIKTFTKYFGGSESKRAAALFSVLGINCKTTENSDTTEAMKLWDTTIYAWNVVLEKEIHDWCDKHGVDFDIVYTDANKSYNEGYELLNHPEYKKYILKHISGPIGGHCLIPNAKLLGGWIADLILKKNSEISH